MASDQNAFLDSETVAAPHEGPRQSLAELAYERLKRKILTLEFAPGAYLNEAAIAKSIEIGRNPVHHAVKQLVFEGMLEIMPRKGLFVKPLDLAEMLNVAEARLLNEEYCARKAAEYAAPGDVAALRGIIDASVVALRRNDIEAQMFLDRDFHCMIFHMTRNPVMEEMLRLLHERSLRNWFISLKQPRQAQDVLEQHKSIADAIAANDPDAAGERMRDHIRTSRANLARQLAPGMSDLG